MSAMISFLLWNTIVLNFVIFIYLVVHKSRSLGAKSWLMFLNTFPSSQTIALFMKVTEPERTKVGS